MGFYHQVGPVVTVSGCIKSIPTLVSLDRDVLSTRKWVVYRFTPIDPTVQGESFSKLFISLNLHLPDGLLDLTAASTWSCGLDMVETGVYVLWRPLDVFESYCKTQQRKCVDLIYRIPFPLPAVSEQKTI